MLIPADKTIHLVEDTYEEYFKMLSVLENGMGEEKLSEFITLLETANEILLEEKTMGRNLITGASGNVGRYAAQYTLGNGQQITAAGTHTGVLK